MTEKILTKAVLGFACKPGKVLLARKKRKIGKGLWNGYGGGIDEGETPEKAMVRELQQESGLVVQESDLLKRAVLDFHNITKCGHEFVCRIHTYVFYRFTGHEHATDEMGHPRWFPWQNLPVCEMMPADRVWLPVLFTGELFYAEAWYGPGQKTLRKSVKIDWWREDLE